MSFTFSHPALILPLAYLPARWFSISGLVIGSMVPDFEFFLRMNVQSTYSHTFPGLFLFNLPLGILIAFIYHNIVRDSLFDNLPFLLKSRLSGFKQFNWNSYFKKNWMVIFISLLVGATSHIIWDSFTHWYGYFVKIIPVLRFKIEFFGMQMPVFMILQHLGTIIGGLVILFVIFSLPVNRNVNGGISLMYWFILFLFTIAIIFIRIAGGIENKFYTTLIVTAISAFMISLIVTSLINSRCKLIKCSIKSKF
jgi:hypothetical protein